MMRTVVAMLPGERPAVSTDTALSAGKRVVVDPHLCEGHALCLESAPAVFDLSDDDVATCVDQPSGDGWQLVHAAIDACPRGAISIVEH